MQHVTIAAVHTHVGYWAVPTSLLEEDQVAPLEVVLGYPLANIPVTILGPILFDRTVRQPLAEAPEDELCKARAVFLLKSQAGSRWRQTVRGAEVLPALSYEGSALTIGARGTVNVLAACAAFGRREVFGRRRGGAPDDRDSVGDDLARAALWGDAHDVAVAGIHLIGAKLDPHASVSSLVHLYPLGACGRLHTESRSATVTLSGRPPSVESVVAVRGSLQLEARVAGRVARRDVVASMGPYITPNPFPPWRFEAQGLIVVHDLRVVGQALLLRHVACGRKPFCFGGIHPRDGALRDRKLRCAIRSLRASRKRSNRDYECGQNSHQRDHTKPTHEAPLQNRACVGAIVPAPCPKSTSLTKNFSDSLKERYARARFAHASGGL